MMNDDDDDVKPGDRQTDRQTNLLWPTILLSRVSLGSHIVVCCWYIVVYLVKGARAISLSRIKSIDKAR
eukprot:scaffold6216_cov149-Amphora_coffeaeformis.AAC.11